MSERKNGVLISAPLFGIGKEKTEEFSGYNCGYCQGNGYFQGDITKRDPEREPCPKCGGTGRVKAVVTVEWMPDGVVKPYFREP